MTRLGRVLNADELPKAGITRLALGVDESGHHATPCRVLSAQEAATVLVSKLRGTGAGALATAAAQAEAMARDFEERVEVEVTRRLAQETRASAPPPPPPAGMLELRAVLAHEELLALGKVLAERLIFTQLSLEPATLEHVVAGVLSEARGARRVQLSVSPSDHVRLGDVAARLGEWFAAEIEVILDQSLGSGDLIIKSELGQTDARINTRLDCLLELIRCPG